MATELPTTNGHSAQDGENNFAVKAGLARMLKGGVIMDVINAEQVRFHPSSANCLTHGYVLEVLSKRTDNDFRPA
jgi:pyridoxal 5'-phosphate synthase pdxS subunit